MGKKVLVVDDSGSVRQQVGMALSRAGYEIVEACNGNDGLEKIKATADLAMIICDINMPQKDGLEMLASMNQSGLMRCPVVMLTAEAQPAASW